MNNIWIAMSGGVDSSGAALLVKERYAHCGGVTLTMQGNEADQNNVRDAAQVCEKLGISHTAVDCVAAFREKVMGYFAQSYLSGETPNPCVICNREIKFGLLLEVALRRGYDGIATGHYARIYKDANGHCLVQKAKDVTKDQSYVLAMLTAEQLRHCVFPLGDFTKPEIRTLAAEYGFLTAHKSDSQDICFIPNGDYVDFLTHFTGHAPTPGNYVDEHGQVLGQHKGYPCYTIGQRKGLGIALGRHMFVLRKDAARNEVTLGDETGLFTKTVDCAPFHPQTATPLPDGASVSCKLRYAHKEAPARLWYTEEGCRLEFDTPQRAPTPGQFAVCYDGDIVLGGAVIR